MHSTSGGARPSFAFTLMGGANWSVGPVYLANLLRAARRAADPADLGLYALATAGDQRAEAYAHDIGADGVIWHLTTRRPLAVRITDALERHLLGHDAWLERTLLDAGVQVLLAHGLAHSLGRVATLGWLPDFQHRHLPDLFSPAERRARDRMFTRTARRATRIVVISDAVRQDFLRFMPRDAPRVRVLKPVADFPRSTYAVDPRLVLDRYALPERFFHVPNHFWVHKNHATLFQAVSILRSQGVTVNVVCTGPREDYRHPAYFDELMERVKEWGITDRVFPLGLIPRADLTALMRQSVAIVSPSLFEGWGYAVEEARSLGKRVVISDIATHREQASPMARYFDPHDSQGLAACLREVWTQSPPGPDPVLEEQARADTDQRMRDYGAAFLAVAREAIAATRG